MKPSLDRLADKLDRARQELAQDQAQAQAKQTEQWVGLGESVMNFMMGKRSSRVVSSATSKWNRASAASAEVEESKQTIAKLEEEQKRLQDELQEQVAAITARWDGTLGAVATEELKPRRTDVDVQRVALAWTPIWQVRYDDGARERTLAVPAYHEPEVG